MMCKWIWGVLLVAVSSTLFASDYLSHTVFQKVSVLNTLDVPITVWVKKEIMYCINNKHFSSASTTLKEYLNPGEKGIIEYMHFHHNPSNSVYYNSYVSLPIRSINYELHGCVAHNKQKVVCVMPLYFRRRVSFDVRLSDKDVVLDDDIVLPEQGSFL